MDLFTKIKTKVTHIPILYRPVVLRKAKQFEKEFQFLCDYYYKKCGNIDAVYNEDEQRRYARRIVEDYAIKPVLWNDLNILFIDDNGAYTQKQFLPALSGISNLFVFDWLSECGATPKEASWSNNCRAANEKLTEKIKSTHEKHGIHAVLTACNPGTLLPETIAAVKALKIPSIRYNADDKQNFHKHLCGVPGNCPMIQDYTLCWTTARVCALWAIAEGGRSIFLPEGAAPELFRRNGTELLHDVSFLGLRYGPRAIIIDGLRKRGIGVKAFGPGWENGFIPWEKMGDVFSSTRINFGIGGIRHSTQLVCLKGRDFEVPMSGGLYLTTYNPEFAPFFRIGHEILCYKSEEEAIELIHYYLSHPEEANAVREAGYRRAHECHTWRHRLKTVFEFMGILEH